MRPCTATLVAEGMHRAPIPHQLNRINSTDSRGSIVFTTTLPFATSTHSGDRNSSNPSAASW